MPRLYANLIDAWERRLAERDTNRIVRPFEWGLDWLEDSDAVASPAEFVSDYNRKAVACSDEFFRYLTPSDFSLDGGHLTFTSPLPSLHPENNQVHADYFPAKRGHGRAVVVLPQWNADATGHAGLSRLLARCGVSALRMSMAYHDRRMPPELQRADFHVSTSIGRTIHASRQSVIDARACLDWLEGQGYDRLGVLGTSLGSCIAFIAAAHDTRVRAGVFNHVSTYFGDVVWTGLATRHVRQGFADDLTQDQLRDYWRAISPVTYVSRLAGRDMQSLLIWARHDTSFLPEYSKQFIEAMFAQGCPGRTACLPCAHYTTGEIPFKFLDAFHMCRFLRSAL